MHEVMNFPNNPQEFIEQYSFKDTEKIYTNGSMLIPVFRVEQLVAHYIHERNKEIVKRLEDYEMWKKNMIYDLTPREFMIVKEAIKIVKEVGVDNG